MTNTTLVANCAQAVKLAKTQVALRRGLLVDAATKCALLDDYAERRLPRVPVVGRVLAVIARHVCVAYRERYLVPLFDEYREAQLVLEQKQRMLNLALKLKRRSVVPQIGS